MSETLGDSSHPHHSEAPAGRRRWPRGQADCPECQGDGRVRRRATNKDGSPRRRARWERCPCVRGRCHGAHNSRARPVVLYGAPLEAPVAYPAGARRPQTRGECEGGARPCPYVGCRANTYLETAHYRRALRINYGDRAPEDVPPTDSCVLDLVDAHPNGMTLKEVALVLGCTRERVRQIEVTAMKKLARRLSPALHEALVDRLRVQAQREYTGNNWAEAPW